MESKATLAPNSDKVSVTRPILHVQNILVFQLIAIASRFMQDPGTLCLIVGPVISRKSLAICVEG